jgi:cellulose synthase/poly-beta-1,6-N-acetylglucosamine synthase-like glycosyltransferase
MNFFPDFSHGIVRYFFFAFAGIVFLQLFYTLFFHARFAFYTGKRKQKNQNQPPVSVIIAARNESDNLFHHLPLILQQNYPNFEVIVVNHQSIDESYHVLNAYKMQYPHLRIIEVERSKHLGIGKKLPLTLGIKAAKNEHLVFTDADCIPKSNDWLRKMVENFSEDKSIVIGYGPYQDEKGLLNKLIRLDTAFIAMNYFSFALAKLPFMAVGRNLAYTKTVFNAVHGYKSHYSISSGDDDLFIQEAAKKRNYTIEINSATFCTSKAKKSWSEWVNQKTRHYSTSGKYQVFKKGLLGIYPMTVLLMWIFAITLFLNPEYRWITLSIFGGITVIKWLIQARCLIKLREKGFIPFLPFLDLFYAVLMPTLYYTSEKATHSKWK